MSNFLEQLPIRLQEIARRVNVLTPEAIMTKPSVRFMDTRDSELHAWVPSCTPEDVRILKEAAAKWMAQELVTVDTLLKPPASLKWAHVTFGCPALDQCTNGGVSIRGITEICGASGVGKSQVLLQLSLSVQLPKHLGGLGKGVACITTEGPFPSRRLLQISKAFEARYPQEKLNFLGNIFIEHQYDSQPLLDCVNNRLPQLLQEHSIGLIVIDSVAAIFRLYTDFRQRARDMRRMVHALLTHADKYECAIVVSNQVTSAPTADGKGREDVPCLGLQWANLSRTRMRISRVPKQHKQGDQLLTVRKLEVVHSPDTPSAFTEFLITEQGVVNVPMPARPQAKKRTAEDML